MILGIIASEDLVPAAESGGAVASMDFANGSFAVEGVPVTADDVTDHPENIVPGHGLILGTGHVAEILGAAAALLTSGSFTIVAQWYRIDDFASPFVITDDVGGSGVKPLIRIDDGSSSFLAFDAFGTMSTIERDIDVEDAAGLGSNGVLHGAALTRTDEKLALSLDQASVLSDTTPSPSAGLTRVFVGGFGTSDGPIILRRLDVYDALEDELLPPESDPGDPLGSAPNDNFASPIEIFLDQTLYGINTGCGKEVDEPDHAGNPGGASQWFVFNVPSTGNFKASCLESTIIDPLLALYSGTDIDDLTEIGSDAASTYEVEFSATMGDVIRIAIDGYDGEEGFFSLSMTEV